MKKARVIVTLECNRHCGYCCNTPAMLAQATKMQSWDELADDDEIMITGGEPSLLTPREFYKILGQIHRVRKPSARVYLYTALYVPWLPLEALDGIQYTLHTTSSIIDVAAVKDLENRFVGLSKDFSSRLRIVKGLQYQVHITPPLWSSVKLQEWIPDCPLPRDERLLLAPGVEKRTKSEVSGLRTRECRVLIRTKSENRRIC